MDGKIMIVCRQGKIEIQSTLTPAETYLLLGIVKTSLERVPAAPANGVAPPTESEAELLRRLRH